MKLIKTLLCCGGLLFISLNNYSQTIDLEKKTKEVMFSFEASSDGILIDSLANFGLLKKPHEDLTTLSPTKAYIFRREMDTFKLKLHVWYHFDKTTLEIKGITYNWGLYNPSFNPSKNRSLLEELTHKEKDFKEKYNSIFQDLSLRFGNPIKHRTIIDRNLCAVNQEG